MGEDVVIVEGTTTMRTLLAAQGRNAAVSVHEFVAPAAGGAERHAAPFDLVLGDGHEAASVLEAPRSTATSAAASQPRHAALPQDEGGRLRH